MFKQMDYVFFYNFTLKNFDYLNLCIFEVIGYNRAVREKVRENIFFFSKSGNFEIGQGNLKINQKVREKSENLKKKSLNELDFKN